MNIQMINSSIIDCISTGICVVNDQYTILVWNSVMENLTGIKGKDIFGKKLFNFFPKFLEDSIKLRLDSIFSGGPPILFSSLLNRDLFLSSATKLQEKHLEVVAASFTFEDGSTTLLFTINDETELNNQIINFREMRDKALEEVEKRKKVEIELRNVNEKLESIANTDPLTGLFNRRNIKEKINNELERKKRHSGDFSLILSDIDFFKNFNDNYGHDCGDYVLKQIAIIMENNLRSIDTISRWGGEEFLIFLPETSSEEAQFVAEKIREQIFNHHFIYMDRDLNVTMTFGIAQLESSDENIDIIIKRADIALYKGKEQGRNCVVNSSD